MECSRECSHFPRQEERAGGEKVGGGEETRDAAEVAPGSTFSLRSAMRADDGCRGTEAAAGA